MLVSKVDAQQRMRELVSYVSDLVHVICHCVIEQPKRLTSHDPRPKCAKWRSKVIKECAFVGWVCQKGPDDFHERVLNQGSADNSCGTIRSMPKLSRAKVELGWV